MLLQRGLTECDETFSGTQQSKDKVETSRPFHGMDEWTKPSLVKSQDDCDTYNLICHCLHHYHVIYIYTHHGF